MIELSEILSAASRQRDTRPEPRKSPPDVLCLTLQETAERYVAGCPFKPGDLVTPRAASPYTGSGNPHIVLEVAETPFRNTVGPKGDIVSHLFGSRLDVRVACEESGVIVAFWQESWQLEPYTGPGSEPEMKAA